MPQTTRSLGVAVLAPIFAGTFVALLDLSIVIVALPTIHNELNTDVTGVQWVVDAFVLPLGALLLSGGALGDRYGRKRLFLGALALLVAMPATRGERTLAANPSAPSESSPNG